MQWKFLKNAASILTALCLLAAIIPAPALAAGYIGDVTVENQFLANGTGTHQVNTSALNVRSGPGTGYDVIGKLYRGNYVQVTSINGDFCGIKSDSGVVGYVSRMYLTPSAQQPTPRPTPTPTWQNGKQAYRATTSLNVRTGAGTNYSKLTTLTSGAYVYKLADVNSQWMKIQLMDGRMGYAMSFYLNYAYTEGANTTPRPTTAPQNTPRPTAQPTGDLTGMGPGDVYLTTGNVNLRAAPNYNGAIKTTVRIGAYVTLLSRYSDTWYYVRTKNGIFGYISSNYLKYAFTMTGTATPTPTPSRLPATVDTSKQVYSFDEMKQDMNELYSKYPSSVSIFGIGRTMWGDQIPAVCIGNRNASKALLIDGGIHGREYMSTLLIMRQMEYILDNQSRTYNGKTYASMLEECCIWFVPMINPDGVYISQNGVAGMTNATRKNNLLAMNGGSTYFDRWKANGYGVDLNRNFESGWGYQGKPSGSDYSGSYANSESETQAMISFVNNHTNVKASINYHTTGNYIYWHYGQTGSVKSRDKAIADKLSSITGYYLRAENTSGKGGGFMDWMIASRKLPSFTLELGNGSVSAPQDIAQFPAIWSANYAVPMFMVDYIINHL